MDEQDLYDLIQNNPQLLEQLLQSAGIDESTMQYESQLGTALRNKSKEAPAGIKAGEVYVAANPLQHLAHGLEQREARKMEKEGLAGLGTLPSQRRTWADALLKLLRRQQQGSQGVPPEELIPPQMIE